MTPASRERPKAIRLTEEAAARVRALMEASDGAVKGLRVGVKNAGCAGMAYTMERAEEVGPHDEVVEDKGATVLIDPGALLFLLGSVMDYRVDKLASGFVFDNPNVVDACGCGESVKFGPPADA